MYACSDADTQIRNTYIQVSTPLPEATDKALRGACPHVLIGKALAKAAEKEGGEPDSGQTFYWPWRVCVLFFVCICGVKFRVWDVYASQ